MFCPKCGKQLVAGEVCTCQQPAYQPQQAPQQPTQQPQMPQQQAWQPQVPYGYQNVPGSTPALAQLRKTLSSGVFLAIAILFTVAILLNFIYALMPQDVSGVMEIYEEVLEVDMDEIWEVYGIDDASQVSPFGIGTIIGMIPSILICIGLWMLYANAKNPNNHTVNPGGLTCIKGAIITELVIFCIAFAFILLVLAVVMIVLPMAMAEVFNTMDSGANVEANIMTTVFIVMMVLIIGIMVFCIIYYAKILKTVKAIKFTLMTGQPNDKVSQFFIVMLYVSGVFTCISAIAAIVLTSPLLAVGSLCQAVVQFMAAYALGDYKKKMRGLMYPNYGMPIYQTQQPYQQPQQQQAYQQPQQQQAYQQPQPTYQQPVYQAPVQPYTITYTTCEICGQQYPSGSATCPKCGAANRNK